MTTGIPQIPSPAPAVLPGAAGPLRPQTPIGGAPAPRKRGRSLLVVGVLLTLIGALGVALLVRNAGHRVDVLALARDVPVGQQIQAADLTVAALPADPALEPISADDKGQVVGRRAGVNLSAGTLVTRAQLMKGQALRKGEELVAVEVQRGKAPTVQPEDAVKVVATPGKDEELSEKAPPEILARVVEVGRPNASGAVVVQVAVPSADSSLLAARAATGRVAIVLSAKG
ncbi:SAF domain-containing protein [Streptomyces sp. T-3]|nr:SAF domain-containing protein [Streptomyces sp. T-3]